MIRSALIINWVNRLLRSSPSLLPNLISGVIMYAIAILVLVIFPAWIIFDVVLGTLLKKRP